MPVGIVVAHPDQKVRDRIAVALRAHNLQVYAVADVDGVLATARQAKLCAVLVEPGLLATQSDVRPRIKALMGYHPPVVALTRETGALREVLKRHGASILATPLEDLRPLISTLVEVARRLEAYPELLEKVTDSSARAAAPVRRSASPARPAAPTVLVVDDEATFRAVVTESLTGEGYQVFSAASAQDAVRFLGKNDVDLVISDVNMPGMDGFQLKYEADRIRGRAVPFIVVTADATLENVFNADAVGAVKMLAKPLQSLAELFEAVRSALPPRKNARPR